MGITMGESFKLDDLAKVNAADKHRELIFSDPTLPITGAVGSPIYPIARRVGAAASCECVPSTTRRLQKHKSKVLLAGIRARHAPRRRECDR